MNRILTSPYDLVAEALEATRESIDDESSMGEHPHWDSLNHVGIIVAIENHYGISIPDSEIMKYDNMKAIIALYEKLTGRNKSSLIQRIKEGFKKSAIGKIFFK